MHSIHQKGTESSSWCHIPDSAMPSSSVEKKRNLLIEFGKILRKKLGQVVECNQMLKVGLKKKEEEKITLV